MINLYFAWCWLFAGLLTGALQGLWFHRENWLGGYDSWQRRLTRLGHIAFFGTGLLNLCFAFTILLEGIENRLLIWSSSLLIIGAVTMPAVCYLSAWRKTLRHLFIVPVFGLISGIGLFLIALFTHTVTVS